MTVSLTKHTYATGTIENDLRVSGKILRTTASTLTVRPDRVVGLFTGRQYYSVLAYQGHIGWPVNRESATTYLR